MASLRTRLTLSSVGISLTVLLLLFSVSWITLGRFLETNNVSTTRHNLQIVLDILDREVASMEQLMSWFAVNAQVQDFVGAPREAESVERKKKLAAYEVIRSALYGNTLYSYVNKLIIVDKHGRAIQMGSVPGHWSDAAVARKDVGTGAEHLVTDPFLYATPAPVIALSKVIQQESTGEDAAWIHVTLNTDLLTKYLSEYTFEQNSRMFFVLGDAVLALDEKKMFHPSSIRASTLLPAGPTPEGSRLTLDGKTQLFVSYQAKGSGWALVQSVPTAQLDKQNSIFLVLFGFVGMAMGLLVVLILTFVHRTFNQPIDQIQTRLASIALGNFGHEPGIEFRNELGDIGRGINSMSKNIEDLIATRVDDERAKKNLEFKVLQSQINPHFLYNTLNSIKWMAEIQKSRGIAEMAGSLAILLKHLAKGTDEAIPLGRELDLVKEFCVIQDFRTGGLAQVKMVVEDPGLREALILKFTLQPLVENALHHGIEPTGRPGTIVIHAHRKEDCLWIDVTDDGVGMTPEELASWRNRDPETNGEAFNPVGLKNVDERIKLRFGADYGLSLKSEWGIFTTVSVRVPLEFPAVLGKGGDDVYSSDRGR